METTRHQLTPCPVCGYNIDAATRLGKRQDGKPYVPEDGSISLCAKCGTILRYLTNGQGFYLVECPQRILDEMRDNDRENFLLLKRAQTFVLYEISKKN